MMKKVMYFLFLSAFCLLALEGYAQDDTGGGDSGNGNGVDDDIPTLTINHGGDGGDTSCYMIRGLAIIYATNLVLNEVSKHYMVPSGTPEIFVQVSLGGITLIPKSPTHTWSYIGNEGTNNEPLFRGFVDYQIDYETICGSPAVFKHEIVTVTQKGISPYPVCGNSNIGGVYSCGVFTEIPCPSQGICNSSDHNVVTQTLNLSCHCDYGSTQNFTANPSLGNSPASGVQLEAAFDISSTSNPFGEVLELNWKNLSDDAIQVLLYNAAGKVLERSSLSGEYGNTSFATAHLPRGLYILVAQNGVSKQTIKLIKQ